MRLKCNQCGNASEKTDVLKLRTIRGRDYLLCLSHYDSALEDAYRFKKSFQKQFKGNSYEESNS